VLDREISVPEVAAAHAEALDVLAELVQDPDFKASVRRAAEHQAADRADGDQSGLHRQAADPTADRQ
jgi:hypothetical protein